MGRPAPPPYPEHLRPGRPGVSLAEVRASLEVPPAPPAPAARRAAPRAKRPRP